MTFHFAPAVRAHVSLLIALAGASGSGKTFSALRLAKGMSPSGKIAFIDTEARRGLHYADQFSFLHTDMRAPFRPDAFIEAIRAAEGTGAEVVIIDNFSDEYEGEGGICEWAEDIEAGGTKSPGNWKIPKGAHKKMMGALLQFRVSVIFCLRADEKIKIARENNKTVVVPMGWMPICEKRFMYNMTMSFTLTPDAPGRPHFDLPHKLQQQHRSMFSDQEAISENTGRALAAWARGDQASPPTRTHAVETAAPDQNPDPSGAADHAAEFIEGLDKLLASAAAGGTEALKIMWDKVPNTARKQLKAAMDRRHKPTAAEVDASKVPSCLITTSQCTLHLQPNRG